MKTGGSLRHKSVTRALPSERAVDPLRDEDVFRRDTYVTVAATGRGIA
jgi:hypothetical protein